MKSLLVVTSLLLANLAHASYFATHCSNSTGSVKWETGHNSNSIHFEYFDEDGEQVKSLAFSLFEIKEFETLTIKEENIHRCGFASTKRVYVQKVIIKPAENAPTAMDFLNTDKLETEVICTYEYNGRAACPNPAEDSVEKP